MEKMISYDNKEIIFNGCPGCAYAKGEFSLTSGMIYEDEMFTLSQDWELPIQGFLIISPKRHIETLEELTDIERNKMFELVNKTISILRKNNICNKYNVIFEEKENIHFHVWLMPRHDWMKEITGKITGNIKEIMNYSINNLKTEDNIKEIEKICNIVREGMN